MKTLLTFALALSLGASTFAKEGTTNVKGSSHVKTHEKTIKVTLGEDLGKVRMTITDENGKKLHQRMMMVKSNVTIPFNLSELPAGQYNIEVASFEKKDMVGVANYKVETKEPATQIQYPLMASGKIVEDNRVRLSVFGLEKPGVKILIKDEYGKVLHKETINEEAGFIKYYNFKNIDPQGKTLELEDVKGRQKTIQL
ncbi:DUF3244 domain-containing protein [Belliella marina]|uniref:DUF3244 domain-containing protein n=1 Tax=Belliella marina TaxID=1644146 RepID=A0ABW4VQW4_9BACT